MNLDKLQEETEKLLAILRDRQPGMLSWNISLGTRLMTVVKMAADVGIRASGAAPDAVHVVHCVCCGHEYPTGTTAAKHALLLAHIKVCEKHPMREVEARIERLRKALVGLLFVETKAELEAVEAYIRALPGPINKDKLAILSAVLALLDELAAVAPAPVGS